MNWHLIRMWPIVIRKKTLSTHSCLVVWLVFEFKLALIGICKNRVLNIWFMFIRTTILFQWCFKTVLHIYSWQMCWYGLCAWIFQCTLKSSSCINTVLGFLDAQFQIIIYLAEFVITCMRVVFFQLSYFVWMLM